MGQFKRQDVTEYERIDPATGEVTDKIRHINTSIITKPIGEENFIKIYYDTFLATMGKQILFQSSLSPLVSIWS